MSKSTAKKVVKKGTRPASKAAAGKGGAKKKSVKPASRGAAKPKSGTKKAAVNASGRKVVKKTTKKAAKPAPKSGPAAKKKSAAAKSAKKAPAAKPVPKKTGKTAKSAAKRPTVGTAKKSARSASARKGRRDINDQIDVKTGSMAAKPGSFGFSAGGSGVSFLNGKPGSSGLAEEEGGTAKRLTRTKLNARELRGFRELLIQKRRQLLGDMDSMETEALRTEGTNLSHLPVHMADMGTDNYEQEFTLNLVDRDRKLIDEIDHALAKIDNKTYGICEGTGQMITKARLEAQPWARFSIEYARRLQQPGMRR